MPIVSFLENLLSRGGSGVPVKEFECDECGNRWESAKQSERAQCTECLSDETTVAGTVERD